MASISLSTCGVFSLISLGVGSYSYSSSEADQEHLFDMYTGSLPTTGYSSGTSSPSTLSNQGEHFEKIMEDLLQGHTGSLPATFYSSRTSPPRALSNQGGDLENIIEDLLQGYTGSLPATLYSSGAPAISAIQKQGKGLDNNIEDTGDIQQNQCSLPAFTEPDICASSSESFIAVTPLSVVSESMDKPSPRIQAPIFLAYDEPMHTLLSLAVMPDRQREKRSISIPAILTTEIVVSELEYGGSLPVGLDRATVSTDPIFVDHRQSQSVADQCPAVHEPSDVPETLHTVIEMLDALAEPPQLVTPTTVDSG